MASSLPQLPPVPRHDSDNYTLEADDDDDDADTASQRSISLSSPPDSRRQSSRSQHQSPSRLSDSFSKRESHPYTLDTDLSSEADDASMYTHETGPHESPTTSAAPSVYDEPEGLKQDALPTYPPVLSNNEDRISVASFASGSSRKARPESMLVTLPEGPLVLGIALIDFNHMVYPAT